MLIYPFHNGDTQSQLPTRVGFGFGLASKGEIMVVEWQIGKRSNEFELRSEPFFSFDEKVYDVSPSC